MRNIVLISSLLIFFGAVILTSCLSSSEKIDKAQTKVEEAKQEVIDANRELNRAVNDSVKLFKKETLARIVANEKSIADFKARIASQKKENEAEYNKKLMALEQKNSDMKKKLDELQVEGQVKWESFKSEFSKDMDELGTAFVNFGKNSK